MEVEYEQDQLRLDNVCPWRAMAWTRREGACAGIQEDGAKWRRVACL